MNKPERRSDRYEPQLPDSRLRHRLFEIIFEADTPAGKAFDVILLILILISVVIVCLESVPSLAVRYGRTLYVGEWIITVLFTVEYVLRLYCIRNRKSYATSFYGIIDLLAILPTWIGFLTGRGNSFAILRAFRLMRVFRILQLFNLSAEAESLGRAVVAARDKIVVFLTFVGIIVTVSGTMMYEIENFAGPSSAFRSIPDSIYWAIVTMTTVGYGDIVPQTPLGKFISAILILIGYSLIIVPTGFVSAEIMSVRERAKSELSRTCPNCLLEGHQKDARYCRGCGALMEDTASSGYPANPPTGDRADL
jgi:voltage-gated potassium channel